MIAVVGGGSGCGNYRFSRIGRDGWRALPREKDRAASGRSTRDKHRAAASGRRTREEDRLQSAQSTREGLPGARGTGLLFTARHRLARPTRTRRRLARRFARRLPGLCGRRSLRLRRRRLVVSKKPCCRCSVLHGRLGGRGSFFRGRLASATRRRFRCLRWFARLDRKWRIVLRFGHLDRFRSQRLHRIEPFHSLCLVRFHRFDEGRCLPAPVAVFPTISALPGMCLRAWPLPHRLALPASPPRLQPALVCARRGPSGDFRRVRLVAPHRPLPHRLPIAIAKSPPRQQSTSPRAHPDLPDHFRRVRPFPHRLATATSPPPTTPGAGLRPSRSFRRFPPCPASNTSPCASRPAASTPATA